MLQMLKIDLGITGTAYDDRLLQYLDFADKLIRREGADLTDSLEDRQLVVIYAAWLWRRRDSGAEMPRMLRWMLNNRIFGEKAGQS